MPAKSLPLLPPANCLHCEARCDSTFQDADPAALQTIDELRRPMTFRSDEPMAFTRRARRGFFCIGRGHAVVHYTRGTLFRPLRVCGPGDMLGYGNWHWDDRCHATALDRCLVCFFERDSFEAFAHASPTVSSRLAKVLSLVILQKSERIAALGFPSVRSRVAATLLSLERKFGVAEPLGSRIAAPMPRAMLAGLSGTVIESLSRTLTELEREGILLRRGRTIIVCDVRRLEAAADASAGNGPRRPRSASRAHGPSHGA